MNVRESYSRALEKGTLCQTIVHFFDESIKSSAKIALIGSMNGLLKCCAIVRGEHTLARNKKSVKQGFLATSSHVCFREGSRTLTFLGNSRNLAG